MRCAGNEAHRHGPEALRDDETHDARRIRAQRHANGFVVKDNGVVQTLIGVGHEQMPLDITLTIDVSGSVFRPEARFTISTYMAGATNC